MSLSTELYKELYSDSYQQQTKQIWINDNNMIKVCVIYTYDDISIQELDHNLDGTDWTTVSYVTGIFVIAVIVALDYLQ